MYDDLTRYKDTSHVYSRSVPSRSASARLARYFHLIHSRFNPCLGTGLMTVCSVQQPRLAFLRGAGHPVGGRGRGVVPGHVCPAARKPPIALANTSNHPLAHRLAIVNTA